MRTVSEGSTSPPSHSTLSQNDRGEGKITMELVQNISDRVYAMLVSDLKIERERRPTRREITRYRGG